MAPALDSLNVATAAAVALYALTSGAGCQVLGAGCDGPAAPEPAPRAKAGEGG